MRWVWKDGALHPVNRKLAEQVFVEEQHYPLVGYTERSGKSHRHFFATVHEAWLNLPETIEGQFASSEHLRKYALIKGGFYNERSIVCASVSEARKIAAFLEPRDEFAIVTANGNVVTEYTAKSQAETEMEGPEFQRSKEAVLAVLADMLGVPVGDLPTSEAA